MRCGASAWPSVVPLGRRGRAPRGSPSGTDRRLVPLSQGHSRRWGRLPSDGAARARGQSASMGALGRGWCRSSSEAVVLDERPSDPAGDRGQTHSGRPAWGGPRGCEARRPGEGARSCGAPVLPDRAPTSVRAAVGAPGDGPACGRPGGEARPFPACACAPDTWPARRCGCAAMGAVVPGASVAGREAGTAGADGPSVASPSVANSSAVSTTSRRRSERERMGRRVGVREGNMCS